MSSKQKSELWKNRISEQQASGLTIVRWCKEHEILYRQFHYWKKQLSTASCMNHKSVELFAEIPALDKISKTLKEKERIHLSFHGVEMDVPETFHPDTLLGLMKVLQHL